MRITPLHGGITASVWRVDFDRRPSLVLKYFDDAGFVAEDPGRAGHEASVLELLATTPVPAPELIAFDGDGSAAGAPAVLMTAVAGQRAVPVPDPGAAAALLAGIHRIDAAVPWTFHRYNPVGSVGVPPWGDARLWSEAIAAISGPGPDTVRCFIYRDFHHHNIVWDGPEVSGVVDWLSACLGPPGIDIARFRLNTLIDGHPHVGDEFAAAYLSVGVEGAGHPFWNLVDGIDLLLWYVGDAEMVADWPGDGADPGLRALIEAWIAGALGGL